MTATYYPATAATTLANPPLMLAEVVGGAVPYPGSATTGAQGMTVWFYSSTNTPADLVVVPGTFSDGYKLGISQGDILFGVYNGGAAVASSAANPVTMYPYMGVFISTESSLTTAAYRLSTVYST